MQAYLFRALSGLYLYWKLHATRRKTTCCRKRSNTFASLAVKLHSLLFYPERKSLRIDLIDPPTLLINPPVARLDGAANDEPAKADPPTDALCIWIFKRVITPAPDGRKFITAAAVTENLEVYPNKCNENAFLTISWSDISNLPHAGSKASIRIPLNSLYTLADRAFFQNADFSKDDIEEFEGIPGGLERFSKLLRRDGNRYSHPESFQILQTSLTNPGSEALSEESDT